MLANILPGRCDGLMSAPFRGEVDAQRRPLARKARLDIRRSPTHLDAIASLPLLSLHSSSQNLESFRGGLYNNMAEKGVRQRGFSSDFFCLDGTENTRKPLVN